MGNRTGLRPDRKNKRTTAQKAADMVLFEEWSAEGYTLMEMVGEIATLRPYTLSNQQISADLKKLSKIWIAEATQMRTEAVANELKGLRKQERELWKAWRRSQMDATIKTAEKIGDEEAKSKRGTKTKVTVEGQTGEAAYMRLILDIRQQRRELLGLDVAKELKLLGDADKPLIIVKHAHEIKIPKEETGN